MKKRFKQILKNIDKALLFGITVLLGIILGFLYWILDSEKQIEVWVVILVSIGWYIVCLIVYAVVSIKTSETVFRLPLVKKICYNDDKITFVVEKNELYSQGMYVTICYQADTDELEIPLGLGYVDTINDAGYMQISFQHVEEGEKIKKLLQTIKRSTAEKNSIKIKPTVLKDTLDKIKGGY